MIVRLLPFFMDRTDIRKHTLINTTVKNGCKWFHNSKIIYLEHSNGNIIMTVGLIDIYDLIILLISLLSSLTDDSLVFVT